MEEILKKLPAYHAVTFRLYMESIQNTKAGDMARKMFKQYLNGYAWALHMESRITLDEYFTIVEMVEGAAA